MDENAKVLAEASSPGEMVSLGEEGGWFDLSSLKGRALRTVVALLVALVSFFPVATWASSVETHANTIATLDEKQANVLALSALAAAASAGVGVFGDAGAPIADQLAELSSDLAVITIAVLTEKYLLTVTGLVAFRALIPVACVLYAFSLWGASRATAMRTTSCKLALFGILLFSVVPASAFLANCIDETYGVSSEAIVAEAEGTVSDDAPVEESGSGEEEGGFLGFLKGIPENVADAAADVSGAFIAKATSSFNNLLEAFAVMVVTSCVLPILVLLLALWLVNVLLGIDVSAPMTALKAKPWRASAKEARRKAADAFAKSSGESLD